MSVHLSAIERNPSYTSFETVRFLKECEKELLILMILLLFSLLICRIGSNGILLTTQEKANLADGFGLRFFVICAGSYGRLDAKDSLKEPNSSLMRLYIRVFTC